MKGIANTIAAIGILIFIYACVGRFVGAPTIGLGYIPLSAKTGVLVANSLMLIATLIKIE